MAEFRVTIESKITRHIRVTALSAAAARAEIVAYGESEAWSDYPCVQEIVTTRIVAVKRP